MSMATLIDEKPPGQWIESAIQQFCSDSPENSLANETGEKAWDTPLVGFSNGNDTHYQQFKEDIGSFFLTPIEIFRKAFPSVTAIPSHLTVISWILPQTQATRSDNRAQMVRTSERWARSRHFGEKFNVALRDHLCDLLLRHGIEAVAPSNAPFFERAVSEHYSLASNWSERHAAYVSGLGTFGLCDGLITKLGKAVRCGSVIAHMEVPPTERPYSNHHAYCLHFSKGRCDGCIKRCPVGAVTKAGHDKIKCENYLKAMSRHTREKFGFEAPACGFCQTGVPCEMRIPVAER
ncbi:MAG: epoxyqueuosine reductase [Desulfobacteraceae bacterium]|nr:epoxyqueuosine reductase [Desulfobacteraceae bacterium]